MPIAGPQRALIADILVGAGLRYLQSRRAGCDLGAEFDSPDKALVSRP